jgi:hypothetical protein
MKINIPCTDCLKSDVCGMKACSCAWLAKLENLVDDGCDNLCLAAHCTHWASSNSSGRAKITAANGQTRNVGCCDCAFWAHMRTQPPTHWGTRSYKFGDCVNTERDSLHVIKTKNRRDDSPPCRYFRPRQNEEVHVCGTT